MEITGWVDYKHDGSYVNETTACNFFTSANLNPVGTFKYTGQVHRISNDRKKAIATCDVQVKVIFKEFGPVLTSMALEVWGDTNENQGGSVTPY